MRDGSIVIVEEDVGGIDATVIICELIRMNEELSLGV